MVASICLNNLASGVLLSVLLSKLPLRTLAGVDPADVP